ncbi:MAG: dipeptidyl aminopeptidase [Henriciella sp.]|jgi:dipeptidyl aminopeptidase/acylaminoacyl peptidase|uniref:S9 family peptidase n=1 Tax=Henriciella sp. TaxID=1968823 RepID=UPI000C114FB5|nr:S9 family peptidase [Henriciella sp.]MAN73392.1 dipeptidyl aminopeptidase [Henriciella sp.]MBF33559.1 dipeptidyl aminopeptidase [Hyphomonadaceae bacterium]MBK76333.1 dipeptidyl aminopeptidase [Henriciella sp.]PHR76901.1 MAG: dipeptidyl aminopeptidase [Henriciella sp.]|tara:strand:- start:20378 stop:22399 length:2022 start_codon:yes stop_codon:yes gene_type:complete
MHKALLLAFGSSLLALAGLAQSPEAPADVGDTAAENGSYGGQAGPDMSIEAMSPEDEAVNVGLAGQDPANIARYLLASGAGGAGLSPDGETIAFRWDVTGEAQLWTLPAEGGQPRQLTFGNGITFSAWAPDSETLVYGADNDGNEQESYYRIAADGSSEALVLPAVEGGFRVFGDFGRDGETVAFASTERNGEDFDIYIADLSTGETARLYEGVFGFYAHEISPDGTKLIVSESVGEDSDNLYLLDIESREMTTIAKPDPRANHADGGFAWLPDSSGFYFSTNDGREFSAITRYDLATGETTTVKSADHDLGGVILCGESGEYMIYTENADGFDRLHIDREGEPAGLDTSLLPEGQYQTSCPLTGAKLSIHVNGWRTPGDVYVMDLETGELDQVFASDYAGLDPDRLIRPESVRMTARDGVELQGLLYLPDESSREADGPPPVIFFVHGGPTGQSVANFDAVVQYHLDRGLAVFEPNVRGSTGFGRTYVTLDDQKKRRDSVRDLIDMLAALEADGRVDTSRAAVVGGSYGGYMVNAVLALYPDAFDAGAALFGVGNWVTALQVASPSLKASDRIEYGDISEQEWVDYYTENSPVALADNIKVPVLYSHGVQDPRIDISETEIMVKTLRENGIETPYIRIPDEGHGWRKLKNQLYYFRRQANFLEEQLTGETAE